MTPIGISRRRSTKALVNWVVPIITLPIAAAATFCWCSKVPIAATTPLSTSAVVGVL
jgi:hypothetical protein